MDCPSKKCSVCGRELPLSNFYKNCKSKDGHKGQCIDCIKKIEKERYSKKYTDEDFAEKERARGRERYKRLNYKDATWNHKTRKINPLECNTSRDLRKNGFDTEGKEAHHWNYNEPKSVFLLSRKAHKRIHQYIIVNYDDKFCYTKEGEKLDTVEKAKTYFKGILDKYGIDDNLELINYN